MWYNKVKNTFNINENISYISKSIIFQSEQIKITYITNNANNANTVSCFVFYTSLLVFLFS